MHECRVPGAKTILNCIRTWYLSQWGKGGYHEIILPYGRVQLCYDPIYPTNGIGNHNTNTYHICVVGNGAFTAAQERAFEERCLLAMENFGLGVEDVLGHNEFKGASTACPGINMNVVRNRLKELKGPKKEGVVWLLQKVFSVLKQVRFQMLKLSQKQSK